MNSWLVAVILGAVGFTVQSVVMAFVFARKLSEVEIGVRREITEHQESDSREFAKIREEIRDEADQARSQVGETVAAIRTKVNEVELFARDEFLRKGSFNAVIDRLEKRLIRIEDGIIEGFSQERKGRS